MDLIIHVCKDNHPNHITPVADTLFIPTHPILSMQKYRTLNVVILTFVFKVYFSILLVISLIHYINV